MIYCYFILLLLHEQEDWLSLILLLRTLYVNQMNLKQEIKTKIGRVKNL